MLRVDVRPSIAFLGVALVLLLAATPVSGQNGQVAGSPPAPSAPNGDDLIAHVPSAIESSCSLTGATSLGEISAVECHPSDANVDDLIYRQFQDLASLQASFQPYLDTANTQGPGSDCTAGPSVVDWTRNGEIAGQLACSYGDSSPTTFAWTDVSHLILTVAGLSGGFSDAYDWWVSAGPVDESTAPTEAPAPTSLPHGAVLYNAGDFSDWDVQDPWAVTNGLLVASGSGVRENDLFAPVQVQVDDYVVDVDLQFPAPNDNCCNYAGILIRGNSDGSFAAGVGLGACFGCDDWDFSLGSASVQRPYDKKWHHWRVTAIANVFTLAVDGKKVLSTTDNSHVLGGGIGFYTGSGCCNGQLPITARNLRVTVP